MYATTSITSGGTPDCAYSDALRGLRGGGAEFAEPGLAVGPSGLEDLAHGQHLADAAGDLTAHRVRRVHLPAEVQVHESVDRQRRRLLGALGRGRQVGA